MRIRQFRVSGGRSLSLGDDRRMVRGMRLKIWLFAAVLTAACGSSSKTIRTPLKSDDSTRAVITRGAAAMGCEAGGHDELLGIMIDCPDGGRIVFGRDSGENIREEKEGEPYPIEVHCYRSLADKCQATIDRIMAEGKK